MQKYIFVTGGIVSGIGKGITVASLGALLKARGVSVVPLKIDPYLNIDAGTMNPFRHGEVFVTEDGAETDLDLGHYERFLDQNQTRASNLTTGSIFQTVIERERRGDYLGEDIQLIPHVTDAIIAHIRELGRSVNAEVVITEIGGTVGNIESEVFLEAARQAASVFGRHNVFYIHVAKIDYLYPSGEEKTKPIQHSVQTLRQRGIQPDLLVVRCRQEFSDAIRQKLNTFTDVAPTAIISAPDASIYEIPLLLERGGLGARVAEWLGLDRQPALDSWKEIVRSLTHPEQSVRIAIVGKYLSNPDAYLSVMESVRHGGFAHRAQVEVVPIDAETLSGRNLIELFEGIDGVLVPGGFGSRGVEGKILAIRYAREGQVPFLGLCLGLQCATIEYARSVCGHTDAHSTEFEPATPHPVVDVMAGQQGVATKGGTMRLGSYEAVLQPGSLAQQLYGTEKISERHRHRYEINPSYHRPLEQAGLILSGLSPDGRLCEFIELPQTTHPFFIATQAHPEFKSRPDRAHPLFAGFIGAALERQKKRATSQTNVISRS